MCIKHQYSYDAIWDLKSKYNYYLRGTLYLDTCIQLKCLHQMKVMNCLPIGQWKDKQLEWCHSKTLTGIE